MRIYVQDAHVYIIMQVSPTPCCTAVPCLLTAVASSDKKWRDSHSTHHVQQQLAQHITCKHNYANMQVQRSQRYDALLYFYILHTYRQLYEMYTHTV